MAQPAETTITKVPILEMKDTNGNLLFFENDDHEIVPIPGIVPADTVQKEIKEGIHHAGS